ncbi:MAG: asparagine synthase (glutamine-hydrolyzing) [Phycisphaerae bacterium]|nr:asparagine synthase (glutamine-hydrolyzing) [Gemmatimonadaceae bacterium]
MTGRVSAPALSGMLDATRHRGPDDSGTYVDDHVAIGMNRLSILDLSHAGHQPMLSADEQLVLVYNGEMYNFREERQKLEGLGHSFRSHTDTEVVLALYQQYGRECLRHMRGMFAFALWDKRKCEMFAARDHLGIKPFLYALQPSGLIFCSELKGMVAHPGVPKTLDRESLYEYLVNGHINQPRTIFSRVKSLEPGHSLVWKADGSHTVQRYWSAAQSVHSRTPSYDEAVATTRKLVMESVAEELVSDVPLGVFLSGGVDSNVVVAAMQASGASRIQTYSIGFGGESDALDESEHARESAKFFGTEHYAVDVSSADVAREFENMVSGFDQPVVDGYNTYLVSKHARTGVTVALSGLGGDEVFGGYHIYRTMLRQALAPRQKHALARATRPVWQHLGLSESRLVQLHEAAALATIPGHYSSSQLVYKPAQVAALLRPTARPMSVSDLYLLQQRTNAALDDDGLTDPFQHISLIAMRSFMTHRLLRDSDAVSMKHSLEIRVPLIDKRLIEYIFPLPWDLKFKRDAVLNEPASDKSYATAGVKRLLVDAFEDLLPPGMTTRVKRGFTMPLTVWLDKAFSERMRHTFESESSPLPKTDALAQTLARFRAKKSNPFQVWSLVVLVEWLRQMGVTTLDDME